jgi:hypothetical protein
MSLVLQVCSFNSYRRLDVFFMKPIYYTRTSYETTSMVVNSAEVALERK